MIAHGAGVVCWWQKGYTLQREKERALEAVGWNINLIVAQLVNIAFLLLWIGLAIAALRRVREQQLDAGQLLGWSALIVLVPIIGALAALLVLGRRSRTA
jgi:hypothetical protein